MQSTVPLPPEILLHILEYLQPLEQVRLLKAIPSLTPLLTPRHVSIADHRGETLLHKLALEGKETAHILTHLLQKPTIPFDCTDSTGTTPFMFAASSGYAPLVREMLARTDIDANARNKWRISALFNAVEKGHCDVVGLLLAHHAAVDINQQDSHGRTPLLRAIQIGAMPMIEFLLGMPGLVPDLPDRSGQTPLAYACVSGPVAAVKLLLARGDVDANARNGEGRTPLAQAALAGACGYRGRFGGCVGAYAAGDGCGVRAGGVGEIASGT